MIPKFTNEGTLPSGIHWTDIDEIKRKLCFSSKRIELFKKLEKAMNIFKKHGCQIIYIDGSFATNKTTPGDIDVCWDTTGVNYKTLEIEEPVFFDFRYMRAYQKLKYGCEFFPYDGVASVDPFTLFLDFFQKTRDDKDKGIIGLKL